MRDIYVLPGVNPSAASGAPVIPQYAGNLYYGSIPGWEGQGHFDPDYPLDRGLLNMCNGVGAAQPPSGDGVVVGGSGINYGVEPQTGTNRMISDFALNPTQWSIFFALRVTNASPSAGRELVRPEGTATTGVRPRIAINTIGRLLILENGQNDVIRLTGPVLPTDQLLVAICTFSTRDGLRMFVNGELVAQNTADKRALTDEFGAGEFAFGRNNSGSGILRMGIFGALSIDLGAPENAGYRRALERGLAAKYAIQLAYASALPSPDEPTWGDDLTWG